MCDIAAKTFQIVNIKETNWMLSAKKTLLICATHTHFYEND